MEFVQEDLSNPPFSFYIFGSSGVSAQGLTLSILARQSLYHLSHSTSPFFVKGFFEMGFRELFASAGFEPQSF
jgi:hypothetical protein